MKKAIYIYNNFILCFILNILYSQYTNCQTKKVYIPNTLWLHITSVHTSLLNHNEIFNDSNFKELKNRYQIVKHFCPFKCIELKYIYKLEFNKGDIDSLIMDLKKIAWVSHAEKCNIYQTYISPNDTNNKLLYFNIIQGNKTWDLVGNNQSTIAIIDDAIMTNHPDLKSNIYTNIKEIRGNNIDDDSNGYIDDYQGWDVANNDSDANPDHAINMYHGTLVSGAASAVTNNGIGIASVSYNSSKIIPIKASNMPVFLTNTEEALDYAINIQSKIINMSFGTSDTTNIKTISNILNLADQKNMILIAAAGNDGTENLVYPAAFPFVFAVGATTNNDKVSSFSQYGSFVDLMAPGNNIYSTTIFGSLYDYESGTSMSCPIVASSCALLLSVSPNLSNKQVYQCLKTGADNIENINDIKYKGKTGSGRLNIYNSMLCALNNSITNNLSNNKKFYVYPNPALNNIQITINNYNNENCLYELYRIDGCLIYEGSVNSNNFTLDVSGYANGIYILKIKLSQGEWNQKIVIQK